MIIFFSIAGRFGLETRAKTCSKNSRHIILSYCGKIYYVDLVQVHFCEGKKLHNAVFHAREARDSQFRDVGLEIPHRLYDILVEYTKLDNADLILLLNVGNASFSWGLISETWLKQYTNKDNVKKYVA